MQSLQGPVHPTIQNPERLARLRATGLLDAPTEEAFDRLTRLAAKLLEAPLSTVTLVDEDRQFYASCVGVPEPLSTLRETPLQFSFCKHTVVLGTPLVIPDVRGHPIVGDNPAIGEFGVRAYVGIPLLTSDGYALGTLCVMDFQVRHWTEDQVASLRDLAAAVSTEIELRMDIAERVRVERALQESEQEARRAVGLRDEVLGIVSHDLRNPVHTIGLSASFLLDTLAENPDPERLRKQLGIIRRASEQMSRLIEDLLDVASIAAGSLSLEPVAHSASALVDAACETLQPIAAARLIRLVCEASVDALAVRADPNRILQVLSNLVGNAVKFTPRGGRIVLDVKAVDGEACFSVADSGPGMSAEQLPRIFDQFWQGRAAGRHGAGLGLAISKGIVEAHGGRIWAESSEGMGTTLFFTVPIVGS